MLKSNCFSLLIHFKKNKFMDFIPMQVAMRWRTEPELVSGRGQFTCGEKHCTNRDGLRTWEVNFAYVEHSEKKNALIKLSEAFPPNHLPHYMAVKLL